MKHLTKKIAAITAGILLGGLVAAAAYVGYNPVTGLNGTNGIPVATGTPPVITGTCGTIPAAVGGGGVFQVTTAGVTTCTLTVTLTSPAPNGVFCVFVDETHPADAISQASHNTTSCTSTAATISAGDNILVELNGF